MLDILPIANSLEFSIKSFRLSKTGAIIEDDATMVFDIYDSAGSKIEGPVSMSHESGGNYFGNVVPNPVLTESARYKVVITSTTYVSTWVRWFKAEERGFPR